MMQMYKVWNLISRDFVVSGHMKNMMLNFIMIIMIDLILIFCLKDHVENVDIFLAAFILSIVFSFTMSMDKIFGDDFIDGTWDLLISYNIPKKTIFLYKLLNLLFITIIPIMLNIIIFGFIFLDISFSKLQPFLYAFSASIIFLGIISVVLAIILSRQKSFSIFSIIYIPMIIAPIIIMIFYIKTGNGLYSLIGMDIISAAIFLGYCAISE